MLENTPIEMIVSDVPHMTAMSESRVKNTKKIEIKGKPCVFFKDMECRAPVCDMDVCSHCPEGNAMCSNYNRLKNIVKSISMFFVAFLIFFEF